MELEHKIKKTDMVTIEKTNRLSQKADDIDNKIKLIDLDSFIPYCCVCHKAKDENNSWYDAPELQHDPTVQLTHTYCPKCYKKEIKAIDSSSRKILIADDDHDVLYFWKDIISRIDKSIDIKLASDGKEAFEIAKKHDFGFRLYITDLDMPIMNGYEFLSKLGEYNGHASRVVVSGNPDLERLAELGIKKENIYQKPVMLSKLYDIIENNFP